MKIFLQLIPTILSMIVTAAHFLRAGDYIFMTLSISILLLLFFKYRLFLNIVRASIILSTAMWLNTMTKLIKVYTSMNIPINKIVYILGGVIIFQILAFAIIFFSKSVEDRYSIKIFGK